MHRINIRVHNASGIELGPCGATEAIGRVLENPERLRIELHRSDGETATYTCRDYRFGEEPELARWVFTLVSASGENEGDDIILFYYHKTQKYGSGWEGEWEMFCKRDFFPKTLERIVFRGKIYRANDERPFSGAYSVTFVASLQRLLAVYKRRRKKRLALDRRARRLGKMEEAREDS